MPEIRNTALERHIERELDSLCEQAEFRALERLDRTVAVNRCSNDDLGLSDDARLKQAVLEAVASAEAVGSTGSRLLSGISGRTCISGQVKLACVELASVEFGP